MLLHPNLVFVCSQENENPFSFIYSMGSLISQPKHTFINIA